VREKGQPPTTQNGLKENIFMLNETERELGLILPVYFHSLVSSLFFSSQHGKFRLRDSFESASRIVYLQQQS
jgi:hypothetical protein